MSSPRIPRATILPSGPTRTNAGMARTPNVPGVGPWIPPPRKACVHGSFRFSWNFFGSSIFSSTLRLRIANFSSLRECVVDSLKLGNFGDAGSAPRRPEVEQDVLALEVRRA